MYHKNNNNGLLLEQISNYIDHAPYRRIKRSGSLGLSNNSVRNLMVFKKISKKNFKKIGLIFLAYEKRKIMDSLLFHGF